MLHNNVFWRLQSSIDPVIKHTTHLTLIGARLLTYLWGSIWFMFYFVYQKCCCRYIRISFLTVSAEDNRVGCTCERVVPVCSNGLVDKLLISSLRVMLLILFVRIKKKLVKQRVLWFVSLLLLCLFLSHITKVLLML